MLNVSKNRIEGKIKTENYRSFSMVNNYKSSKVFVKLLMISFGVCLIALFLPWTQNIRSKGAVTTIQPDQRPQTINSIIAGKMEKWFVKEVRRAFRYRRC